MVDRVLEEWDELSEDYKTLELVHEKYLKALGELTNLQQECLKQITHQRYRMKKLTTTLSAFEKKNKNDEAAVVIRDGMMKREAGLQVIEEMLPKKGARYLKLIIGNIDVSFLNKHDKFKYKDDYEKFKLINHVVALVFNILMLSTGYRFLELIYLSFLAWYYCTTSIRESILRVNGSRIKGWWRLHHILSTISSGVLLVWPDNEPWRLFRTQFIWFNIYSCLIQYLQFKYQRGVLYRLKALGERDNMDITIEGFHFWMWRGLTFLLPFLFVHYIYDLVNAVVLYRLSFHPQATWQVPVSSVMFFIFFLGNTSTTIMVVPNKLRERMMFRYRVMTRRVYHAVSERVGLGHR